MIYLNKFLIRTTVYFLIPILIALLIILKSLILPNCMSFDKTDEGNHTFVNIFRVQELIRQNQMPLINLYNNFGTPIIGDQLTLPYSFLSIAYWILPYDIAMGFNRFLVAAATIFLLTFYYKKYLSYFSACVCSILVFFSPSFFWTAAHHHYQASILVFTALLLFVEKLYENPSKSNYLILFALSSFCVLSVNLNIVLIIYFYISTTAFIMSGFKPDKKFFFVFSALCSGIIFYLPDIIYFIRSIPLSVRVSQNYPVDISLLLRMFIILSVFGAAITGALSLSSKKNSFYLYYRIFFCGILSFIAVSAGLMIIKIWHLIPFIASTDISRFWWFSNVYMTLGAGFSFDLFIIKSNKIRFKYFLGFSLPVLLYFFINNYFADYSIDIKQIDLTSMFCFALLLIFSYTYPSFKKNFSGFLCALICIGLCYLSIYYCCSRILGYSRFKTCRFKHFFSEKGSDLFNPAEFIDLIKKNERIAVEIESFEGYDLKITRNSIFGSSGRSVLLNKSLGDYLIKNNLIEIDQVPFAYHFKSPWNAMKLSELGIKYVMQKNDMKENNEFWSLIGSSGEWRLYENKLPTGIIYLLDSNMNKKILGGANIIYNGNEIKILLPDRINNEILISTFAALPGWKAMINGSERKLLKLKNNMLGVSIRQGDKNVLLYFQPFSAVHFIICSLLAIAIPVVLSRKLR
ncbi:MAG TPA: hypothetical protein PKY81_16120 [bacterium]|nr:hypothetical protein [bacterium]